MLSDIERKILRIIGNYHHMHNDTPTIREIEIKTGRSREGVMKVLAVLNEEKYIEWSDIFPERITLLEAWEREPLYKFDPKSANFNKTPFIN